ncbi:MAG TPA: ABC transporter permease [Thermoanaerobaculia bacterium]|jgi:putative ABC transport system permease protein|nr:ABC transporter permease [Thermoanaerobaculia bacterium]
MRTTRLLVHGLRAMPRFKLRSGFIILGVTLGVSALTLVVSVGRGVETKMLATIRQILGDSSVLVIGGGGRLMGSPRGEGARLTIDDVAAVAREVPEVEQWDPQQDLALSVRHGDAVARVRVLGQSERWEQVWGRSVARGESFDAAAVGGAARVALVGETVARDLFGHQEPLGAEVRIGGVPFRVIGVLERYGTDMHGMDRDDEIVVPISTLMRRLGNVDTIAAAKLLVRHPERSAETAAAIRRVLRQRHALAKAQPSDFRIMTAVEVQRNVATIRRILLLYVPLGAAVVLLVAAIVSAALMLASVNERVAEIGLRRAVGARPDDIRLQFLVETAVTTLGGGLAGLLLAYVGTRWIAGRLQLGEVFSWSAVLLGIAASTLTGLLAGVAPARRAARLQPVDALR